MVGAFIPSRAILLANRDQHVNTITDALGRVITFNYDGNGKLTGITQGAKTHTTFAWGTAAPNYNFSPWTEFRVTLPDDD